MKFEICEKAIKKFIDGLDDEDKKIYDWIKHNILKVNPNNSKNDPAFMLHSTADKNSPIFTYKKHFIIKYRLEIQERKVIILAIKYQEIDYMSQF